MSLTVLMIAACHAVPPVVGAVARKTKAGVYVGTVIGAALAIALGRSAYMVADLAGVALGAWLGLAMVGQNPERSEVR